MFTALVSVSTNDVYSLDNCVRGKAEMGHQRSTYHMIGWLCLMDTETSDQ